VKAKRNYIQIVPLLLLGQGSHFPTLNFCSLPTLSKGDEKSADERYSSRGTLSLKFSFAFALILLPILKGH